MEGDDQDSLQQVQKKTFGKWINFQLASSAGGGQKGKASSTPKVTDLYYDLRDGHILLDVLQILTGTKERHLLEGQRMSGIPAEYVLKNLQDIQNVIPGLFWTLFRQLNSTGVAGF